MSTMVAGHTKFEPDWHFGLWKRRWRNSNAETLSEVARTVQESSQSGHNLPQLVQDQKKPVVFYEWRDHLQKLFKPLKNISRYHHFRMCSLEPGVVYCKLQADGDEIEVCLTRKNAVESCSMPAVTPTPGMEAARQWYLYEETRRFCTTEDSKNVCCPKPIVPKREIHLSEDQSLSRAMLVGGNRKYLLSI